MSDTMTIKTNSVPRDVLFWYELTDAERKEVTDWIEQHHDHDADLRGDPDAAYEAWRDDQMARRDDWAGEDF